MAAEADWERRLRMGRLGGASPKRRSASSASFGRSLHIRFVDAGACGACISEARQLNNPYYNMHRLGFFMTPYAAQCRHPAGRGAGHRTP